MIPVILESPYAGDVETNLRYCRACMRDSLFRGESPFASHLWFAQTSILDDRIPEERALGINAGFAWRNLAAYTVAYTDLGISRGMQAGIDHAKSGGQRVEYRTLPGWALTNKGG